MPPVALQLPPESSRFAAFKEADGSILVKPVDYFILFDGGTRGITVQGAFIGRDALCEKMSNFVCYGPTADGAKTAAIEKLKR
jgi:hypothetical protein